MVYADLTRNDRNGVKRWLQRKRISDALALAPPPEAGRVLDFGAGDGELARRVAERFPHVHVCCYEPCELFRFEARENTRNLTNVEVASSLDHLPHAAFDRIFCLEVFEHLPEPEIESALGHIRRLLSPGGRAIVGVPVEVFLPALLKGLFRMARRFGDYDARPLNVLRATVGSPPPDRPLTDIGSGLRYYDHHLGFDFRDLRGAFERWGLTVSRTHGSPWPAGAPWLNSEIHFVVERDPAPPCPPFLRGGAMPASVSTRAGPPSQIQATHADEDACLT